MAVSHWHVRIEFDSVEGGAGARGAIWWTFQYDECTLHLPPGWREYDDVEFVRLIAHELGHLICRDLEMTFKSAEVSMNKHAWQQFRTRYVHEIEGVVDRYATIIAAEVLR